MKIIAVLHFAGFLTKGIKVRQGRGTSKRHTRNRKKKNSLRQGKGKWMSPVSTDLPCRKHRKWERHRMNWTKICITTLDHEILAKLPSLYKNNSVSLTFAKAWADILRNPSLCLRTGKERIWEKKKKDWGITSLRFWQRRVQWKENYTLRSLDM